MAAGIFISYRRDDTAGYAGRLYDRLLARYGPERVFIDIDTIRPGHDFASDIAQALSDCVACVVLIGARWGSITQIDGERRLEDPTDFVRLEVATAIRRGITVIPVLVENASPPSASSLPEELRVLAGRQAIELSSQRWNYDVGRLILTLDEILGRQAEAPPAAESSSEQKTREETLSLETRRTVPEPASRSRSREPRRRLSRVLVSVVVAIVLTLFGIVGWVRVHQNSARDPYERSVLSASPTTYWRLNDPAGATAALDTQGVLDEDLRGNYQTNQTGPTPWDTSIEFSRGYAVGKDTHLALQTDAWSIELWFNAPSAPQPHDVYNLYRYRAFGLGVGLDPGGVISGRFYPTHNPSHWIEVQSPNGVSYADGGWHYLVWIRGSTSTTLYVDAQQVATKPVPGSTTYYCCDDEAVIGADTDRGRIAFSGSLAEVAVYSYALSSYQIGSHYAAAEHGTSPTRAEFTRRPHPHGRGWQAVLRD